MVSNGRLALLAAFLVLVLRCFALDEQTIASRSGIAEETFQPTTTPSPVSSESISNSHPPTTGTKKPVTTTKKPCFFKNYEDCISKVGLSDAVCRACIRERELCVVPPADKESCDSLCKTTHENLNGAAITGICDRNSKRSYCPCGMTNYTACYCRVKVFHPNLATDPPTTINKKVPCAFSDYAGCVKILHDEVVCGGCIQENFLCSGNPSCSTLCNTTYSRMEEVAGKCEAGDNKRYCPCIMAKYKACYCTYKEFHQKL